jgi:hypothetical protein
MGALDSLRIREVGLLESHQRRFMDYGRACKDLLDMCKLFAGPQLSEKVLISDMAERYMAIEQKNYDLTRNEAHLCHIKIAQEYHMKRFMPKYELKNLLRPLEEFDFEKAKMFLIDKPAIYETISPRILIEVLGELKDEIYHNDSK